MYEQKIFFILYFPLPHNSSHFPFFFLHHFLVICSNKTSTAIEIGSLYKKKYFKPISISHFRYSINLIAYFLKKIIIKCINWNSIALSFNIILYLHVSPTTASIVFSCVFVMKFLNENKMWHIFLLSSFLLFFFCTVGKTTTLNRLCKKCKRIFYYFVSCWWQIPFQILSYFYWAGERSVKQHFASLVCFLGNNIVVKNVSYFALIVEEKVYFKKYENVGPNL